MDISKVHTAIGDSIIGGTTGSILFIDSSGNLAEDNDNLFFDQANCRLGVCTNTPAARFDAVSEDATAEIQASRFTNNAFGAGIIARKARGTQSSPLAVNGGDTLMGFGVRGYDGSAFTVNNRGAIRFRATSNWTGSSTGVKLDFGVTPDGSTTRLNELFYLDGTECVVNNLSLDYDFRVESDGDTHLLFTEGSTNRVGISESSPNATLDVNGDTRLGDSDTNYSEFETDGTLHFNGNATVWDDLQVNISSVRLPASGAPVWTAYKGGYVLSFSKSADNKIYFTAQIPHSYKEGSDIEFHLHLAYPNAGTGDIRWNFTYSWANMGSDFPAETTVTTDIASPNDADNHQYAEIAASISGTGKTISSVLLCSLEREGTDAVNDDYDDVVYLVALDFHFEKDTVGSRQEAVK